MELESTIFFQVILSGFVTVWTFRHLTKSKKQSDGFEYLGLSAFWGLFILLLATWYLQLRGKTMEEINFMFANPFSVGFTLSIFFSPLLGILGHLLRKPIKFIVEKIFQKG